MLDHIETIPFRTAEEKRNSLENKGLFKKARLLQWHLSRQQETPKTSVARKPWRKAA